MPSRRELIRMTPDEVQAYLLSQSRIIVVSNGADGFPHPMPMNFAVDGQSRILVTTFAKSRKVRNFERDARASLLVESGLVYEDLKAVMIQADTEIILDVETVRGLMRGMAGKPQTGFADPASKQKQVSDSMTKRAILRFTPKHIISWDHAKLGTFY